MSNDSESRAARHDPTAATGGGAGGAGGAGIPASAGPEGHPWIGAPGTWVRPAVLSDVDALIGLLFEIMAHHGVAPPPIVDLRRTLEEIVESNTHEFLIAGTDAAVQGACALIYSLSTWSAGPVCELQDVVVTAESRGVGVGSVLLEAAESRARRRGCRRLFLSAETANLGGHAFYRALGLAEKAVLHFERDLTTDPQEAGVPPSAGLPHRSTGHSSE